MRHQVYADEVNEAENAGLGHAHRFADDGIGFLDRQAEVEGGVEAGLDPEGADAVGDEARRVLAGDDAFAQLAVGEIADAVREVGCCFGAGDDL